jgi:hypothetical protein
MVLDSGMLVGADISGTLWDGSYVFNQETRKLDIELTINIPPDAFSVVTGQENTQGFAESHRFSLPREIDEEVVHSLDSKLGPLQATFKKIREFPNYYSPMNMPDTSGRYVIVFTQEAQPFRVREYPGRLVDLMIGTGDAPAPPVTTGRRACDARRRLPGW